MRRRRQQREPDDVMDLRDRLAPYDDAAFMPRPPPREADNTPPEPALWTPLEFDFDHRPSETVSPITRARPLRARPRDPN